MTKPRRTRAALVPGEQPAERGVHAQVAAPRLGEDQATTTPPPRDPAAAGGVHCRPAAHPARLWPAPRMRSVPPLKGQCVPSGASVSRSHSSDPSYPLDAGGLALPSHPSLRTPRSRCRAAGEVRNVPNREQTPRRFRARKARGREFPEGQPA